ncbi:unnamed protein product [Rhizoctonia solani]|uniref:Oxidoreductase-like domain-containing protein n=1 Tax=Rhizoctonia solani TaxID=456999 RepID=A0A8H2WAI2_9AGAM|nr:unnamed protein product [Rhizoctonia solani]
MITECCMSGCAVCVYDIYLSSLDDYKKEARSIRAQLRQKSVPVNEWPDNLQEQEKKDSSADNQDEEGLDSLDMDPSMKAFLMLEKKLGKK